MRKILLYSSDICPRCNVLKEKLKNADIDYTNISDKESAIVAGIDEVPVLDVDGVKMNFAKANEWINNRSKK